MQFLESEIRQITEWIWSAILERELQSNETGVWLPPTATTLLGAVNIQGAWEGTVALECSEALARQLAATMFDLPAQAATVADTQDALGELTNMVGGNIKSLMPVPSQLSLPQVTPSTTAACLTSSAVVSQVAFADQGEPFRVFLLQHTTSNAQ